MTFNAQKPKTIVDSKGNRKVEGIERWWLHTKIHIWNTEPLCYQELYCISILKLNYIVLSSSLLSVPSNWDSKKTKTTSF